MTYIVVEIEQLPCELISFEVFGIANFDESKTMKLFRRKLCDVYERAVLLFLEAFEQCVAFAEEQVENRHNSNRYFFQVGRGVQQTTDSSSKETYSPHSHENDLSRELAHRFDVGHQMMHACLGVLRAAVEVVAEDVVVQHSPETDAYAVRHVQKLVTTQVCKCT